MGRARTVKGLCAVCGEERRGSRTHEGTFCTTCGGPLHEVEGTALEDEDEDPGRNDDDTDDFEELPSDAFDRLGEDD